ncbi:MAG: 1,2-phenylacetyl-CoA epoxidase subunit PaaC [Bacteroidota bacterium]
MLSINQSTDQLINLLTTLADSSLIMSQRLSEWTGHGPALEQDIAMTNIALDYLGQARHFYQYIAALKMDGSTEDSIAYLRDAHQYRNHLLVELPNGDWGQTILKIFLFAAFQKPLYEQLQQGKDEHLAAIAEKSLKEVNYHLSWSSDWVIRLGDGTQESKERMVKAIDYVWDYTGELFELISVEPIAINYDLIMQAWFDTLEKIFDKATLLIPSRKPYQTGGLKGNHTEHLGFVLAEMQWLQRVYPNSEW